MDKYVCGFDNDGKFLAATVHKGTESYARVRMLNRSVTLTELCDKAKFDLYAKGYARSSTGEAVPPKVTELSAEEVAAQELAQAKAERADAVSKIIVEVDGMKFDGDENSQTRMGRTIAAAVALGVDLTMEKRTWVLADNSIAEVTVAQLAEALRLAGDAQTALWTVPYTSV